MCKKIDLKETGKLLLAADSLVLACHVSPDGDCLGSALGLARFLKQQGKQVTVYVDDDIKKDMLFIPGIEQCQKPNLEHKQKADLFVVIDCSSADRYGCAGEATDAPCVLNIDHHISNTEFADYLYLDAKAAAVGEIMVELFQANNWVMDKEMAICFYVAISTDSGSFRYSSTTPKTMAAGGALLEAGVDPSWVNDRLGLNPRESMELLAKVLPSLTFEKEGRIAYISLPVELYNKAISTESFVSYTRYIEGVDVGIFFKEVEPGVTRVSMRSSMTDVAVVALALGGGGHIRAAGCTVNAPLAEARKIVLAKLDEVM